MINKELIVSENNTLMDCLSLMDRENRKLLIVCDGAQFRGVISIGDIQRALLNKKDLNLPVTEFIRNKITYATDGDDLEVIKDKMRVERIEAMPIVDSEFKLVNVIEWEQLFDKPYKSDILKDYSVMIMAGGKGSRLLPITNIIPKPLIPISDKTIIEEIIDSFIEAGCNDFYVSVNYKNDIITDYLKSRYKVHFIQENIPLGTGGSLYYLKGNVHSTFIVSNCDIIADINYNDLITYHKNSNNMITVVSVLKKLAIPYGTIETGENGTLKEMVEKPEIIYQIISGIYVLEPSVIDNITENEYLDMTDLIKRVKKNGGNVGVFPISSGSWVDMGNWDEYLKVVEKYLAKKGMIDEDR